MNTQTISQFELLDTELLATVEGGEKVGGGEVFAAAFTACGLGAAIGGLAGCILGAQYGTAIWTAIRLA